MTITVLISFLYILTILLLVINSLLAIKNAYGEKLTTYECGYAGILGQIRSPVYIIFFGVGIAFLVFDLEIATLVPLAASFHIVDIYGFAIVTLFFALITFGFIVEICSGLLIFEDNRDN